jgi:glycosyltransferase involved in cell wall biosynthesis
MRILHIIPDTDTGGAEMMLLKLLAAADRSRFDHHVLSMLPVQEVGERIAQLGIPVHTLSMRPGLPRPGDILRLRALAGRIQPDLLQGWMYHGDLAASIAAFSFFPRLKGRTPLFWNIRQTNLSPELNSRSTLRSAGLCARLSGKIPERIICCSEASRQSHIAFGYAPGPMTVIPNGFDTERFAPDLKAREAFRREISAGPEDCVIGLVARLDPQKDHATFFKAARLLFNRVERERQGGASLPVPLFVLVGEDIQWNNPALTALTSLIGADRQSPLGSRIHLLGRRSNLDAIYPGFDISGTSSLGEGFPNVVGEAMSCAIPCVVTDVGDSALLVGSSGIVVPPGSPEALAQGWYRLLSSGEEERRTLGTSARRRILYHYSIASINRRYEALWTRTAPDPTDCQKNYPSVS